MNVDMQEYIAERGDLLPGKVRNFRKNSAASVREAITGSAETLKALKSPVRMIARSGVKLADGVGAAEHAADADDGKARLFKDVGVCPCCGRTFHPGLCRLIRLLIFR